MNDHFRANSSTQGGAEEKAANIHIFALDGLRGLAACVVIVSHVTNYVGLWGGVLGNGGGQIGVMLFFVLSGYLMGLLYSWRPFSSTEVTGYVIHRVARVLPLFYLVVIFFLFLREVGVSTGVDLSVFAFGNVFYLLSLMRGSDVFWTIPVEVQFYAVFVGIWYLYSRSRPLAAAALVLSGTVLFAVQEEFFNWTLVSVAPFFFCGVALSRLSPRIFAWLRVRPWGWLTGLSFPLALFLFPRIQHLLFGWDTEISLAMSSRLWHSAPYLLAASGCLVAARCSPPAAWILSSRPMVHLGKISYSLYLLHMPIVLSLFRIDWLVRRPEAYLFVTLLSAIAVATLVHRFFEAPARRTINYWLAA